MPRDEPSRLDAATVRVMVRLLDERIRAVEVYGAGGCPTCHEAEARAFVAQLRRLADEAEDRA
jgi:hypothetical protein